MTKPRGHSRVKRTSRACKPGILVAMLVAAPAYLATPTHATVFTISVPYVLTDATATFGSSGTDTITGTFSVNFATFTTTSNLTLTLTPLQQSQFSLSQSTLSSSNAPTIEPGNQLSGLDEDEAEYFLDDKAETITIYFVSPLGATPDDLASVQFTGPELTETSTAVTGEAVPAPEPASLALLGGALGLFFLSRRAKAEETASIAIRGRGLVRVPG